MTELFITESQSKTAQALDEIEAALAEANKTLQTASRQLTQDHRMVLNGREWGHKTMTRVYDALTLLPTLRAALTPTETSVTELTTQEGVTFSKYDGLGESVPGLLAVKAERDKAHRACEQMGARITALEAALAIYETCTDDCINKAMFSDKERVVGHIMIAQNRARAALGKETT